jgi:hypothetical protein
VHVVVQLLDDVGEDLGGLLVQVGHGDARGERAEVGVARGAGGSRLGGELIKLDGGNARVEPGDHLLGDYGGIDVHGVEPVAELVNATCDLVEVDHLLLAVSLDDIHVELLFLEMIKKGCSFMADV